MPELLSGAPGKHHVGHYQIDSAFVLFVNLHRILRILSGQNFEARALQNAARRLAHKRLVLYQKNSASPRRLIVRDHVGLKSHASSRLLSDTGEAITWPSGGQRSGAVRTEVSGLWSLIFDL